MYISCVLLCRGRSTPTLQHGPVLFSLSKLLLMYRIHREIRSLCFLRRARDSTIAPAVRPMDSPTCKVLVRCRHGTVFSGGIRTLIVESAT